MPTPAPSAPARSTAAKSPSLRGDYSAVANCITLPAARPSLGSSVVERSTSLRSVLLLGDRPGAGQLFSEPKARRYAPLLFQQTCPIVPFDSGPSVYTRGSSRSSDRGTYIACIGSRTLHFLLPRAPPLDPLQVPAACPPDVVSGLGGSQGFVVGIPHIVPRTISSPGTSAKPVVMTPVGWTHPCHAGPTHLTSTTRPMPRLAVLNRIPAMGVR